MRLSTGCSPPSTSRCGRRTLTTSHGESDRLILARLLASSTEMKHWFLPVIWVVEGMLLSPRSSIRHTFRMPAAATSSMVSTLKMESTPVCDGDSPGRLQTMPRRTKLEVVSVSLGSQRRLASALELGEPICLPQLELPRRGTVSSCSEDTRSPHPIQLPGQSLLQMHFQGLTSRAGRPTVAKH